MLLESDIETQSKVCSVCGERKPFSEFYNFQNKSDCKSYRCKTCDYKARQKWKDDNPVSAWKSSRSRTLKNKYGITLEDYYKMLEEQNYSCKICGKLESDNLVHGNFSSLSVDHCHNTGKNRGLLCNQCNRAIGMLLDSPKLLRKAADYIESYTLRRGNGYICISDKIQG